MFFGLLSLNHLEINGLIPVKSFHNQKVARLNKSTQATGAFHCGSKQDAQTRFFDGGSYLFLQRIYKVSHPAAPVVIVAVGDEDVIFKAGN